MDDPNKRHHIFSNPDHNLEGLVNRCGSQEAAVQVIMEAVTSTFRDGGLVTDPEGRYKQAFDIEGDRVWVSGIVIDGVPRVGTAWVRA